jgi:hypothetical protein
MPADKRPLFTHLNRLTALKLTCAKLADLVRADPALVEDVITVFRRAAQAAQQPDASELAVAATRVEKLSQRVHFVLAHPGETEQDREESAALLRRLRIERADAEASKAALEAARDRPKRIPSEEETVQVLNSMHDVLVAAASSDDSENAGPAREIIELLTGGRIELEQQGERKAQRGWLRGRLRVQLLDAVVAKLDGVRRLEGGAEAEVIIDYRTQSEAEIWADRVKSLYDQELLVKAIAKSLGIGRNLTRKALVTWYLRRGLEPPPDGRSRRSQLTTKHLVQPKYQSIAEEVKQRMDQGELLGEIATALGVDRNTVTAAKNYWYGSRGMDSPDGRGRRKSLERKSAGREKEATD